MSTEKKSTTSYISNPFKLVFEGLDKLFKHNQTMAIIIMVFGLFGTFGNFGGFPGGGSSGGGETMTTNPEPGAAIMIALIIFGILLIIMPIIIFVSTVYSGMVAYTIIQTSRGRTVSIKEAMSASIKKFWVILWTEVIVALKVLGGMLLFIVPGIRAILRYKMVLLPIFEQNASTKQTIELNKTLTKGHLIEVFGMSFAAGIIPFVGPALDAGGQAIMYPQLKALHESGDSKPAVHWLNYIGFLVIGFIVIIVGVIIAAIAALASR